MTNGIKNKEMHIQVTLDEELSERVRVEVLRDDRPVTSIMRKALKFYLDAKEKGAIK